MPFTGTDRTSTTKIGEYSLSVDRDHRGNFRGRQAMDKKYRGWHYHLEHPTISQEAIMEKIECYLKDIKAERKETDKLSIGYIEAKPSLYSVWIKEDRSCVLWISSHNGKLHVEANKTSTYTKNLLSKGELIKIIKTW